MNSQRLKIIIIGAGFGGVFAARTLERQEVEVLIIDRKNFHTFTPLIYQVTTCALDPSDVARPVRSMFRKQSNADFLMGEVTQIDYEGQAVVVESSDRQRRERYDYLILATGNIPTYFGNEAFRRFAFELNTLEDAVLLRNHILQLFEEAVWVEDLAERDSYTTIVVVGGGPTGMETSGAVCELYNYVLKLEFPHAQLQARVILVEMQPELIGSYPDELRTAARSQLETFGVEVMLNHKVVEVTEDHVKLDDDTSIPARTMVWAAGVQASHWQES